jgi:hypothetical protein
MATPHLQYIYFSIFYARERWHELLPVIRTLLYDHELIQINEVNVFFSSHQGSSIRVAIRYSPERSEKNIQKFINSIGQYVKENPSPLLPVQFPIKRFFADFPNNVMKYNLFNERSFVPTGLNKFQLAISQLLLTFFDDHVVDDDAVFTLIINLNRSFLNGVCDDDESKLKLIEVLKLAIAREKNECAVLEIPDSFKQLPIFRNEFDPEETLQWLQDASTLLVQEVGDEIDAYLIMLRMVKLHLKLENEFFMDALHYLSSLTDEVVIQNDNQTKQCY